MEGLCAIRRASRPCTSTRAGLRALWRHLPDAGYYPTRTEIALVQSRRLEIAKAIGHGRQFVDLGAGDCCKAKGWLPFLESARYVAVDIAMHEIAAALEKLAPDFPALELVGVATDFSRALELDGILSDTPALFFYPGSSIGNFTPAEATAFLARVRRYCQARPKLASHRRRGKKYKSLLDAAYDDALASPPRSTAMRCARECEVRLAFDVSGSP